MNINLINNIAAFVNQLITICILSKPVFEMQAVFRYSMTTQ